MSDMITAPYNFVPLNKHVYLPDWADQISHDIPFEDGEDGYIEVTWENVSPLCIRDASTGDDGYSMHVKQSDGSRLYFLPGSSLRGMLRNTLNILAFGKMEQYDNRFFGYRIFDTNKSLGKKYQKEMAKVKFGWLHKDESEDDKYVLYPCIDGFDKIRIEDVSKWYPGYDEKKTSWERNNFIQRQSGCYFPKYEKYEDDKTYCILATGQMLGKEHELLISQPDKDHPISLGKKTIDSFFAVYEPSPYFDEYQKLLKEGTDIPVSYISVSDGQGKNGIAAMGMGRMFRYPYKYDVSSLIEKEQPECQSGKRDLCETIFGWIGNENSAKGRVQICNALMTNTISENELKEIVGVLGAPKASFYPLYLKQSGSEYQTYESDDACIAGRKRYRIHDGDSVTELPKGNGNGNVTSILKFLPRNCKFKMRINVHNLRRVEIGALLSAITFHKTQGVYHNIGSAKGFGYGKLKCANLKLHGLNSDKEEHYLKAFEMEMNADLGEEWRQTEEVRTLMAIMSRHDDACLWMMEMDKNKSPNEKNEYAYYSRNANFSKLEEKLKSACSFVSEEDRKLIEERKKQLEEVRRQRERVERKNLFEIENAGAYDDIFQKRKEGNFDVALKELNNLITRLNTNSLDCEKEEALVQEITREKSEAEKREQEDKKKEKQKERESYLAKGLSGHLNEKSTRDDKPESFRVTDWSTCATRVNKWLRDKQSETLDVEERDILEAVIRRLATNPVKRDQKKWNSQNSPIWKQIKEYLGEERAGKLFEELKK